MIVSHYINIQNVVFTLKVYQNRKFQLKVLISLLHSVQHCMVTCTVYYNAPLSLIQWYGQMRNRDEESQSEIIYQCQKERVDGY